MKKLKFIHGREYFSPSQLKKLYISIGSFVSYLNKSYVSSPQMELGSAIHKRLLEPYLFDEQYIVIDDTEICAQIGGKRPKATKAYTEWYADFQLLHHDKIILSTEDSFIIEKIYEVADASGILDTVFNGGIAETEVKKIVKDYDVPFNALAIIDYDSKDFSYDLKTTSKPLHKFKYDANELGYDIQAALTNSINGKPFVFIVVQTVEPFDIGVFTCSKAFLDRGKEKINKALKNYEEYNEICVNQVLNFEL